MWLARLRHGVLQVGTNAQPQYLEPSGWERLSLLWTFRNFKVLPAQVLTQRELELIQALCSRGSFTRPRDVDADAIIGTIELFSPPPKKAPAAQHRALETAPQAVGHG